MPKKYLHLNIENAPTNMKILAKIIPKYLWDKDLT